MADRAISAIFALILYAVIGAIYEYRYRKERQRVLEIHKLELKIAKEDSYKAGYEACEKSLPIVQHCNSRTGFEFIRHRWDPQGCKHCAECQDLINS